MKMKARTLVYLLFLGISCYMFKFVAARFCEGGHICTLPRECCTQGCCPPYQSGPRQLPPASEHVLNLFFISHWFFWCVVVAIILAVLCAYSLWKKRRTLCGWGFNEHHVQSEGDSAGSCYAPPQYSRCNSFHHPPPPYTEVTSKPDLYPLVFTCNSENGKNGSSYLMVQYFRNYIVRPAAATLSAASTVDSLSSSFICNVNEANTLVPPPYSRAASPDVGFNTHFQQHYMLPRSASQLVCMNNALQSQEGNLSMQQVYQQRNSLYTAVGGHLTAYDALLLPADNSNALERERESEHEQRSTSFMLQQQPRAGMGQSQSSISDIFVNQAVNATQASIQTNPLHRMSTHSVTFASEVATSPVYHSRRSLAAVSTRDNEVINETGRRQDKRMLRRSLESCRQLLQRQQRSLVTEDYVELNNAQTTHSLDLNAATTQAATGGEVRHILEQIRMLQTEDDTESFPSPTRPMLQHTLSTPSPTNNRHSLTEHNLQRCSTMPDAQPVGACKKKYYAPLKPNKAMYIPMVATNGQGMATPRCSLKSPVSTVVASGFFANRSRGRKVWVSRSAPTTPGTCLPPNCFGDDSPLLLNEHEEDQEGEQHAEMELV